MLNFKGWYFMSFHIAVLYIITEIVVCAFSVMIQIIVMKVYHAQGVRPVPDCLMAVARLQKDTKVDNVCERHNQDVIDGGHSEHKSQSSAQCQMASGSFKEDWQHIAKTCDNICFVLFLGFHVIFIVTVVVMLLKEDDWEHGTTRSLVVLPLEQALPIMSI